MIPLSQYSFKIFHVHIAHKTHYSSKIKRASIYVHWHVCLASALARHFHKHASKAVTFDSATWLLSSDSPVTQAAVSVLLGKAVRKFTFNKLHDYPFLRILHT